jgi:rhodanese-related sulfurtransferase
MGLLDFLTGSGKKQRITEALAAGAQIIDVRSAGEFRQGHVKGSRNIPLDRIGAEAKKLKQSGKPVITVCKSGMRSSMAASQLKQAGVDAINGGPWTSLNRYI